MFDEALSKLAHNRQTPIQTSNFCCVQSSAYMMNDVHVLSRRRCGPAKEKETWPFSSQCNLNILQHICCIVKLLQTIFLQDFKSLRRSASSSESTVAFLPHLIEMNSTRQKCDVRTRSDLQFYIIKYIRYYSTFFMFSFLKLLFGKRWKLHFRVLKNKIPHRPPPLLGDLITPFTLEFRKLKQRRQRRQRRRPAKFAIVEIS